MWRKIRQDDAPSIRAASFSSCGTRLIAAAKKIIQMPTPCQTVASTTAIIAVLSIPSHGRDHSSR